MISSNEFLDVSAILTFPEGTPDADGKTVMPGDNCEVQCELISPLALEQGQRFTFREGGRTVATGVITRILG